MSLDLYLTAKKRRQKSGTGVFVRENGKNVELKTIKEVLKYFPGCDVSCIEEKMYESNYIFDGNITHNMGNMASHVPCSKDYNLYHLLWRPDEHGFVKVTKEYKRYISEGLKYMLLHRTDLEQYNPDNGWGNYECLLDFVVEMCKALSSWDEKEEIEIEASR